MRPRPYRSGEHPAWYRDVIICRLYVRYISRMVSRRHNMTSLRLLYVPHGLLTQGAARKLACHWAMYFIPFREYPPQCILHSAWLPTTYYLLLTTYYLLLITYYLQLTPYYLPYLSLYRFYIYHFSRNLFVLSKKCLFFCIRETKQLSTTT